MALLFFCLQHVAVVHPTHVLMVDRVTKKMLGTHVLAEVATKEIIVKVMNSESIQ